MSENTDTQAGCNDSNQQRSVEGGTSGLFEDGDLVAADEYTRRTEEQPQSPAEVLETLAPEKLHRIEENIDELPGTREELIEHHLEKELQGDVDGEFRAPKVIEGHDGLSLVHHQEERGPLMAADEDDEVENVRHPCEECGSLNVHSEQRQMGGADEGMTGFHTCQECGNSWRTGYGA